jgi:hypothetical protein
VLVSVLRISLGVSVGIVASHAARTPVGGVGGLGLKGADDHRLDPGILDSARRPRSRLATNSPVNLEVAIHTKQAPYRTYTIAAKLPGGVWPMHPIGTRSIRITMSVCSRSPPRRSS